MRFWTVAEILRGLDDAFAADKRPAVLFTANRSLITHRRVCGLASWFPGFLISFFAFRIPLAVPGLFAFNFL